ncbi:MAG: uracil-DNA glycosylase, partial [Oricola sp.]|nr:uracil-DNA glycosylase [Oricola sp.]
MPAAKRSAPAVTPEPPENCPLCPRLVAFREENREAYPDYFNGAAPSFGDPDARLLVVGLAPGLHGANRTARPFTGDYAGDLLYATLGKFGFSTGTYKADPKDGLKLKAAMITNAVRCVPPQNK